MSYMVDTINLLEAQIRVSQSDEAVIRKDERAKVIDEFVDALKQRTEYFSVGVKSVEHSLILEFENIAERLRKNKNEEIGIGEALSFSDFNNALKDNIDKLEAHDKHIAKVRAEAVDECCEIVSSILNYYQNEYNFGVTFNGMINTILNSLEDVKEIK